jgi:hypothetical protein
MKRHKSRRLVSLAVTCLIYQSACFAANPGAAMCKTKDQITSIAANYINKNVPPAVDDLKFPAVVVDKGDSWEVSYELPPGVAGGTAVVLIDKKTCRVIRVQLEQ